MAENFKKSDYVKIVRETVPEIGAHKASHVVSHRFPELKNIILCSDWKEKGMVNFKDLYIMPTATDAEELQLREDIT